MNRDDRQERLHSIKALGRIAYRHLKDAEIAGIITVGGEDKRWRKLEENGLSMELFDPFRVSALPTEHSQIQIRFDGRKVFDIRWEDRWFGRIESFHWLKFRVDWGIFPSRRRAV